MKLLKLVKISDKVASPLEVELIEMADEFEGVVSRMEYGLEGRVLKRSDE